MKIKHVSLFALTLIFFACTSDTEDTGNVTKIAPSELVYSEASLTFTKGSADKTISVKSIEKGSSDVLSYELSTSITGISINSKDGTITINNTVTVGEYKLSVDVENSHLSTTFTDLVMVNVEPAAPVKPSELIYNSIRFLLVEGMSGSITVSSINDGGSSIIAYNSAGSLPTGITINSTTGNISIESTALLGSYNLSITAENEVGSTSFNNIVTIVIGQSYSFNGQIKALFVSKCSPCHTTDATGQPWDFTNYANAKSHITQIITRVENGSMPKDAAKLPQAEIDQIKLWSIGGLLEN